jgi:hypothetical protein
MTTGPTSGSTRRPAAPDGPATAGAAVAPGTPVPTGQLLDPGSPAPQVDPAAPVPAPPGTNPLFDPPDATASIGDPAAAVSDPPTVGDRRDPAESSTGELLRTLTEDVRSLVTGEIASARQEITEKALAARPAAAMLGGAAVLGVLATGTSAVVLVRFLDKIFPPVLSAALATALLGGGAAALAKAGIEELRLVGPPVPERTIESVKADVAAVTEATPS